MARPISLGVYPEGPTDVRFLSPVLKRLVLDLCAHVQVDVPEDVLDLSQERTPLRRRDEKILEAVRRNARSLSLVFIHADGAGAPESVREEQCLPGIRLIHQFFPARIRGVAVVPVREMEAWALVDGAAIRAATGSCLDDRKLDIPERPAFVEAVTDPKQRLRDVFERARPRSSRRTLDRWEGHLSLLGELVRLDHLRELSAFRLLESDLREALCDLGVIERR